MSIFKIHHVLKFGINEKSTYLLGIRKGVSSVYETDSIRSSEKFGFRLAGDIPQTPKSLE